MANKNKNDGSFFNRPIEIEPYGTTFSIDAFDAAIRSQGVCLKHYRAIPCPIGMIDKSDIRKSNHDNHGVEGIGFCSNGFLYEFVGDIIAIFVTNDAKYQVIEPGLLTGTSARLTLPRFYEGGTKEVHSLVYDRLYLSDESVTVNHWEFVQAHQTGLDKLNFPAVNVLSVIDSNGIRYFNSDFDLIGGSIKWKTQKRPGVNAETGKGVVYAVRYEYRPFWYVKDLIHEVRLTQVETEEGRVIKRMPQTLLVQREYVFENEDNKDQSEVEPSPRQIKGPGDFNFGPR